MVWHVRVQSSTLEQLVSHLLRGSGLRMLVNDGGRKCVTPTTPKGFSEMRVCDFVQICQMNIEISS